MSTRRTFLTRAEHLQPGDIFDARGTRHTGFGYRYHIVMTPVARQHARPEEVSFDARVFEFAKLPRRRDYIWWSVHLNASQEVRVCRRAPRQMKTADW